MLRRWYESRAGNLCEPQFRACSTKTQLHEKTAAGQQWGGAAPRLRNRYCNEVMSIPACYTNVGLSEQNHLEHCKTNLKLLRPVFKLLPRNSCRDALRQHVERRVPDACHPSSMTKHIVLALGPQHLAQTTHSGGCVVSIIQYFNYA